MVGKLLTQTTSANREFFSESCKSKPNLDCNYHFPIDLAPIRIPTGVKHIGKW